MLANLVGGVVCVRFSTIAKVIAFETKELAFNVADFDVMVVPSIVGVVGLVGTTRKNSEPGMLCTCV